MKKEILVEVAADNSTLLPPAMVQELGTRIWFLRGKDRWEAWKEADLEELLKKDDPKKKKEWEPKVTNPLTLPQAIVRVQEMADLGYTESIVVNDLRKRVERLEKSPIATQVQCDWCKKPIDGAHVARGPGYRFHSECGFKYGENNALPEDT